MVKGLKITEKATFFFSVNNKGKKVVSKNQFLAAW